MTSTVRMCGAMGYCNALRASGRHVAACPHCAASDETQRRKALHELAANKHIALIDRNRVLGEVSIAAETPPAAARFEVYWHHPTSDRPLGQTSAAEVRTALDLAAEHAFEGGPSGFAIVFDCEVNRVIAAFEGDKRIDGGTQ